MQSQQQRRTNVWQAHLKQTETGVRLELAWFRPHHYIWILILVMAIFALRTISQIEMVPPLYWTLPLLGLIPIGLFLVLGRYHQPVALALSPQGYRLEHRPVFRRKVLRVGSLDELQILAPQNVPRGTSSTPHYVLPIQAGKAVYHLGGGYTEVALRDLCHQLNQALIAYSESEKSAE